MALGAIDPHRGRPSPYDRGVSRSRAALAALVVSVACGPVESGRPAPHTSGSAPDPAPAGEPTPTPSPSPTGAEPPSSGGDNPLVSEYGDRPALRVLSGRASGYADSLAGNCTASGDVYQPREHTAASRELAFGTVLRVIRVDTGAVTLVRVNDRGPNGRDRSRILDLSRAAAEDLDMLRAGVVSIRAEVLQEGDGARHRCQRP